MISRFNGICRYCTLPTQAKLDHYDFESKTAFHQNCKDEDESRPDPKQIELADRLGYTAAEMRPRRMNQDRASDIGSINDVRGTQEY